MRKPLAIFYLPIAILGTLAGIFFVEEIIYKNDFWVHRHAHSFSYEFNQSISILLGLATYYISLRETFLALTKKFPHLFFQATSPTLQTRSKSEFLIIPLILMMAGSLIFFLIMLYFQFIVTGAMATYLSTLSQSDSNERVLMLKWSASIFIFSASILAFVKYQNKRK